MIPKIIHYCWFGGKEKPASVIKCIESWKKYCPDYEIIEWNESNTDIHMNGYTEMCYAEKKFAFLSDYIRLVKIEKYGGIYFDTDVEAIKPFDELLNHKAYIGFETSDFVNTGQGFGAEAHNPAVIEMLHQYDYLLEGDKGTAGCPHLNTKALLNMNLKQNGKFQELEHITIYPPEHFNPYNDAIGKLEKTHNTYSIHWYSKSWMSKSTVLRSKISKPYHKLKNYINKRKII